MKVLYMSRSDLFTKRGGDTVQIENTARELRGKNIEVEFYSGPMDLKSNKYDIVHIFNSYNVAETLCNIKIAKNLGKKVVLTPIYHPDFYLKNMLEAGIDKKKKFLFSFLSYQFYMTINNFIKDLVLNKRINLSLLAQGYRIKRKKIFNSVDGILPNSQMEKDYILKENNLKSPPFIQIIPNGVDNHIFNIVQNVREKKDKKIVCIGRIEPLKNQSLILKAFQQSVLYKDGYQLLFFGATNNNHHNYVEDFITNVNRDPQVQYIGEVKQEVLFEHLSKARGLVHASWFETTGLIGLEAGIFEIPVVMTNSGFTKSYFKNNVIYCSPNDEVSIEHALNALQNINEEKVSELKKDIDNFYNWDYISGVTLSAYDTVLNKDYKEC
ncbi:TPA: glycosyltransferase [Bacillus wiedmannii]|nr:glycosyltransferase [Bacillus wiedmannii]